MNKAKLLNLDPALLETTMAVLQALQTFHTGGLALIDVFGTCDWQRMREGVGKLRTLLDDLDLNLQTLENGKAS